MQRIRVVLLTLAIFSIVSADRVFAAGYQLPDQGIAAMGQANAFVAQADDPSAVFYNPAGILQLEGTQLMLGTTYIAPSLTFKNKNSSLNTIGPLGTPGEETDGETLRFIMPHFYVTHRLTDRLGFGFGAFIPYGLATEWPKDWVGRFYSYKAELNSIYFNPVVAYEAMPRLTVAAGVQYVRSSAELHRKLDLSPLGVPPPNEGNLDLEDAEGDGWGYNLGLLYRLNEENNLGLHFRSEVKVHYEGDADFAIPPGFFLPSPPFPPGTPVESGFPDGDVETDLTMPAIVELGWTNRSFANLTLSLDLQWIDWSSYDKLDIDFKQNTPVLEDNISAHDWKDTTSIRLGAEYQVNPAVDLRLGYVWDPSPAPNDTVDPILPDSDRHDFSIGLGYKTETLTVDLAYVLVLLQDRDVDNQLPVSSVTTYNQVGKYDNIAHLVGLSFGYRF